MRIPGFRDLIKQQIIKNKDETKQFYLSTIFLGGMFTPIPYINSNGCYETMVFDESEPSRYFGADDVDYEYQWRTNSKSIALDTHEKIEHIVKQFVDDKISLKKFKQLLNFCIGDDNDDT